MKTIVGLFDTFDEAKKAAGDLQSAGVPQDDISLVANNESGQYAANSTDTTTDTTTHTGHAIGHDAKVGAEIGAVAGLAIGLTGLAIPGWAGSRRQAGSGVPLQERRPVQSLAA